MLFHKFVVPKLKRAGLAHEKQMLFVKLHLSQVRRRVHVQLQLLVNESTSLLAKLIR